ncbi:hypothetical protein Zmor_018321 [Zophobas morio]|uniref:CRAL-TRIO domain-containing protein n=1 Tax=Zophobas morio TaxID=2755281 RepID=A0AA38IDP4_9CUCU|nr:hypothetical protein Zmor_018321 [Zophobas morio]
MILEKPSAQLQMLIRTKCNENVETRNQDLENIKEWLRKQPHLPDTWDDEMLLAYLRNCNFSLEKTKTKLDKFFSIKHALPEIFADYDITRPELQECLRGVQIYTSPRLTSEGYRVHFVRVVDSEPDNINLITFLKLVIMIAQAYLKSEDVEAAGEVQIVDASFFSYKHFAQITPTFAKKLLTLVQNAFAYKIKQFHVINAPALVDPLLKVVSPFLKQKLRNRIYLHRNVESLVDHVPKDMTPEEFGGNAGKMKPHMDKLIELISGEFNSWLKQQELLKSDETKRIVRPQWCEDVFGLDGSFKMLNID